MAKLYEIDEAIMNCVDAETGEIIDPTALDSLNVERNSKMESIALWYKNLISDAEAFKAEKNVFELREKATRNRAESLKKYLSFALNGDNFVSNKVKITYRSSEIVEVTDIKLIDDDYLRFKDPELNKEKIKTAIKNGIELNGVVLTKRKNIQIK